MIGQTISHYEIVEKLGEGGMGVVYKAHDTKLDRTVALKFLPGHLAALPEERQRFLKEAKAAAALNHPNIAHIYEIDEFNGQAFIAMEFIEGKSLREMIDQRPLKINDAIRITIQIAEGLHAAHRKDVIHRDIKSANIMVPTSGQVKIMDFGLAKLAGQSMLTKEGSTLGTAAYMSPEQAQGEKVDKRTDIWSLGVVLYEMIAGQLPFKGDYENAIMYSIINAEPEPLTSVRTGVPPALDSIIEKALAKDPETRYQNVDEIPADLKAIEKLTSGVSRISSTTTALPTRAASPGQQYSVRTISVYLFILLIGALIGFIVIPGGKDRSDGEINQVTRFTIPISEVPLLSRSAISPDGNTIAYAIMGDDRREHIQVRRRDSFESRTLLGTEHGYNPFFSADGNWIGFFTDRHLKVIPVGGGTPSVISGINGYGYGTWTPGGMIYYSDFRGIYRVSPEGGTPELIVQSDPAQNITVIFYPEIIDNGNIMLYTSEVSGGYRIDLLDLRSGEHRILINGGTTPRYSPTGHLIYWDQTSSSIFAVPFSIKERRLTGSPVPIVENVQNVRGALATYDFSLDGTLIYSSIGMLWGDIIVVLREMQGTETTLIHEQANWVQPRFSPDGTKLLVRKIGNPNCDIWIFDMMRKSLSRFTFEADNHNPLWTPDGKRITFGKWITGERNYQLYWQSADGSSEPEQLVTTEGSGAVPSSWSSDGMYLLFTEERSRTGRDIWLLSLKDERTVTPWLQTQHHESQAVFSPDDSWIAYVSDESGFDEIYVRSFSDSGPKTQVSQGGGTEPRWSYDGKYIYYLQGRMLMRAGVQTTPTLRVHTQEVISDAGYIPQIVGNYDIDPSEKKFVTLRPTADTSEDHLYVVLNWFEELKRMSPVRK